MKPTSQLTDKDHSALETTGHLHNNIYNKTLTNNAQRPNNLAKIG